MTEVSLSVIKWSTLKIDIVEDDRPAKSYNFYQLPVGTFFWPLRGSWSKQLGSLWRWSPFHFLLCHCSRKSKQPSCSERLSIHKCVMAFSIGTYFVLDDAYCGISGFRCHVGAIYEVSFQGYRKMHLISFSCSLTFVLKWCLACFKSSGVY